MSPENKFLFRTYHILSYHYHASGFYCNSVISNRQLSLNFPVCPQSVFQSFSFCFYHPGCSYCSCLMCFLTYHCLFVLLQFFLTDFFSKSQGVLILQNVLNFKFIRLLGMRIRYFSMSIFSKYITQKICNINFTLYHITDDIRLCDYQ